MQVFLSILNKIKKVYIQRIIWKSGWPHGLIINESSFHVGKGDVLKFLQTSRWKMKSVGLSAPPNKSVCDLNGLMLF